MRPESNDFTRWCTCGGDHCVRLTWFSDEPDETYVSLIDGLGGRERSFWRRLAAARGFLARGSVCNGSVGSC
jgi:hypothetical protein